jgi:hypothetical protein
MTGTGFFLVAVEGVQMLRKRLSEWSDRDVCDDVSVSRLELHYQPRAII